MIVEPCAWKVELSSDELNCLRHSLIKMKEYLLKGKHGYSDEFVVRVDKLIKDIDARMNNI